jgi:hypothetical protein
MDWRMSEEQFHGVHIADAQRHAQRQCRAGHCRRRLAAWFENLAQSSIISMFNAMKNCFIFNV